jgi:hypothetical protein
MTTPTPPPWDSPQVLMRKLWPNWLDMRVVICGAPEAEAKRKALRVENGSTLNVRRSTLNVQGVGS